MCYSTYMTLQELLSKQPLDIQDRLFYLAIKELGKEIGFDPTVYTYRDYNPQAWTKDGYYPDRQDIDF